MARARNIKPGFFKNEVLAEQPAETRLLFVGLWTLADREGRLEDRPKRIRAELFPFDSFDVDSMLDRLQADGFVTRYEADGVQYVQIENFVKHQDPHYKEKASEIPPPPGREDAIIATGVTRTQRARILERDGYTCVSCGAKEHLCIDHILPVSRGGDSSDENLQVLCMSCNTKKGNKLDGELKNFSKKGSDKLPGPDDFDVDPNSTQARPKEIILRPLIPDSLIPDSLISDSIKQHPASADASADDGGQVIAAKRNGKAYTPEFERAWSAYPQRPNNSKADAFKAWSARIRAGASPGSIIAGVERYAAYCKTDVSDPRYIKQAATFFGPAEHYLEEWRPTARGAPPGKPGGVRHNGFNGVDYRKGVNDDGTFD